MKPLSIHQPLRHPSSTHSAIHPLITPPSVHTSQPTNNRLKSAIRPNHLPEIHTSTRSINPTPKIPPSHPPAIHFSNKQHKKAKSLSKLPLPPSTRPMQPND